MLEHHIQREIVRRLAFSEGLRFSELKPDDIENKLYNYHLKITIRDGYVEKNNDGVYHLTIEGRRMGNRVFKDPATIADSAYSVLFLVVRRKSDGAWLLYRRKMHPVIDLVGFMHATPDPHKSATSTAEQQVKQKTGLNCHFRALGGGFIRTYQDGNLEGFINFSQLISEDATGELQQLDDAAEYFWDEEPDFSSSNMIPNMKLLSSLYRAGSVFFVDERIDF